MRVQDTIVSRELNADDVREFFRVDIAELEPDGSIWVQGPVAGYYLSRDEIYSCMRHLSARLKVGFWHALPSRITVRPLLDTARESVRDKDDGARGLAG